MKQLNDVADIYILGVSAFYHDSAAALIKNGEIVAAAQEERFTRQKADSSFPTNAIKYCLSEANISPSMLTCAVFYESPQQKLDRLLSTQLTGKFNTFKIFNRSMRAFLPDKLWISNQFKKNLKFKVPVVIADHHLSHAASAFYPSPFETAAILTIDGVGEWSTTTLSKGSYETIDMLEQIEFPNSLGLLYSAFTHYTGFKVNSGEYKLMGLAPYGEPKYKELILDKILRLNSDGSYQINSEYFTYLHSERMYNKKFEELFQKPTRDPAEKLTKFHADIAASIQEVLNLAVIGLVKHAKEVTGEENLVLAGGVALNVVTVAKVESEGIFSNIWVQPAAGDAGGSLGAAFLGNYQLMKQKRVVLASDSMKFALLGPNPDHEQPVKEVLEKYQLSYQELSDNDLAKEVAKYLNQGNIVALAKGRMEFGPRALGARSILAPATDPHMQERLNTATKYRENFRPFAPIICEEDAPDYFDIGSHTSPYMLKTYLVKSEHRIDIPKIEKEIVEKCKEIRSTIPAVTHIDYSARVQTISKEQKFLHNILTEYKSITKIAVLVNTSFNVRGEPIVNNSTQAIECFLHTDIDVLVLQNYIIIKKAQTMEALRPKEKIALGVD